MPGLDDVLAAVGAGLKNTAEKLGGTIASIHDRRSAVNTGLTRAVVNDPTLLQIPKLVSQMKAIGFTDEDFQAIQDRHAVSSLTKLFQAHFRPPPTGEQGGDLPADVQAGLRGDPVAQTQALQRDVPTLSVSFDKQGNTAVNIGEGKPTFDEFNQAVSAVRAKPGAKPGPLGALAATQEVVDQMDAQGQGAKVPKEARQLLKSIMEHEATKEIDFRTAGQIEAARVAGGTPGMVERAGKSAEARMAVEAAYGPEVEAAKTRAREKVLEHVAKGKEARTEQRKVSAEWRKTLPAGELSAFTVSDPQGNAVTLPPGTTRGDVAGLKERGYQFRVTKKIGWLESWGLVSAPHTAPTGRMSDDELDRHLGLGTE